MSDEIKENKVWNAYIDKYEEEPFNMGKLHNFAIGSNNPFDSVSFQIAAKIYRRNKGKGKIPTNKEEKKESAAMTLLNSDDIIKLKKQNAELRKQVDELLSSVVTKRDYHQNTDVKEEKKEEKDEEAKAKNPYKSSYKLWSEIDKRIQKGDVDFIRHLLNEGIVTVNSTRSKAGDSMLIIAASNGQYQIVQMLLNLGADVNYKARRRDALGSAQRNGYRHVEKLLMFSKMDASASEDITKIASTLNTQSGFMHYMFASGKAKGSTETVFGGIVDIMIDIISQRQAFSDDILNVAFDYSIKKAVKSNVGEGGEDREHKENKQDNDIESVDRDVVISTDLWQCIYSTCADIITDKEHNKLDWYWLKTYLLSSSIWFRQFKDARNNNELSSLYFELLDIVSGQAAAQIDVYLKQPFKQIADDNKADWEELCAFDVDINHIGDIRQDAIDNGHKSQYTRDILGKKCVSIDPFNAFNHYDTRQYLSSLVLTAQMVNNQFQKDIVKIFDVNLKTLVGKYDCIYKEGPVKLLSRCQAKAETDYRNEKFPVSAHVLDINRCSLIFDDVNSMLRGLKLFAETVQHYEQNEICITNILRIKNGWKEYDHNKPSYADIKFNVVIAGEYHSIIGEVQMLLHSMMQFKNKQHPLYAIERKKEFLNSLGDILPFLTDIPKTLYVNATLGNVKGICDAMVTQHLNVAQIVDKQYENNIFDLVCTSGHVGAARFLMEVMSDEMIIERLNTKNDWNVPLHADIVKTGNRQMLKLIFKHDPFRNNLDEDGWTHIFDGMLRHCDFETSKIILMTDNVYKRIGRAAWKEAIARSLRYGKRDFLVLFTNLCGEQTSKQIIVSENLLQVCLETNWDEYRLDLCKYIINFGDYQKDIGVQSIADALYITVEKNDIDTFHMLCNDLIKFRNEKVEKYLLMPHSKTQQTTLQCACDKGNRGDFIDILLANVSAANIAKYVNHKQGKCTAIAYSAQKGEKVVIDKLLQIPGIDVFGENEQKTSCAILEAVKKGSVLIAEQIYAKLSDNEKNYQYDSKILWETVVSTTSKSDLKALQFVINKLIRNSTQILLNCDVKKGSLITIATENNNLDKVEFICSVIPNDKVVDLINFQTEKHKNAVMVAIDKSNMNILQYFTTFAGVNYRLTDTNGNIPFRNAATRKKFDIAQLLLLQNKTENDKLHTLRHENKSGQASFIYLFDPKTKFEFADIVLKNVDFKAVDLNELNDEAKYGENAVSWAAKIGVMDIVDVLLQIKGICVRPDAILKAIEVDLYSVGELAIADKLYDYLCKNKKRSFKYDNQRLFDIIIKLCYSRDKDANKSIKMLEFVVNELVDNKKDLADILSMKGDSNNLQSEKILLTTMRHKKIEVCKYIMSIIASNKIMDEINFQDEWGNNILEYAAKDGCVDLFKHIIQNYKNANMAAVNCNSGNSTFHIAARYGHVDICELILSQCIHNQQKVSLINLKNKKNETAVMVAKNKSVQVEIQKWKTQFSL